jgi:hypothetical protein
MVYVAGNAWSIFCMATCLPAIACFIIGEWHIISPQRSGDQSEKKSELIADIL